MASTTIADYQVLSDQDFPLNALVNDQNVKLLDFTVPDDIRIENGTRAPILAFKIRTFEETSIKIFLNSNAFEIISITFPSGTRIGWWEAFSFTPALNDFDNPTPVIFTCNTRGNCSISDVVLWYQINRND